LGESLSTLQGLVRALAGLVQVSDAAKAHRNGELLSAVSGTAPFGYATEKDTPFQVRERNIEKIGCGHSS
jgi:hypothetical protein